MEIRTIVYGGGPMYVADIEEAVAVMGPRFVQISGKASPMTITALSRALVATGGHPQFWYVKAGWVRHQAQCPLLSGFCGNDIGTDCRAGEAGGEGVVSVVLVGRGHARLLA